MLSIFVAAMGVLLMSRIRAEGARVGLPLSATANPLDAAAGTASRALLGSGVEVVFWAMAALALVTLAAAALILLRGRGSQSELS
jgi:hypothetical protein